MAPCPFENLGRTLIRVQWLFGVSSKRHGQSGVNEAARVSQKSATFTLKLQWDLKFEPMSLESNTLSIKHRSAEC